MKQKRRMNNKGFSLLELVVAVAIMVVIAGAITPQFIKHVNNAKVAADVTNAEAMANAINVAIVDNTFHPADNTKLVTLPEQPTPTASAPANGYIPNLSSWPKCKYDENLKWTVIVGSEGVTKITLNDSKNEYEVYPDPYAASGYCTKLQK